MSACNVDQLFCWTYMRSRAWGGGSFNLDEMFNVWLFIYAPFDIGSSLYVIRLEKRHSPLTKKISVLKHCALGVIQIVVVVECKALLTHSIKYIFCHICVGIDVSKVRMGLSIILQHAQIVNLIWEKFSLEYIFWFCYEQQLIDFYIYYH